MVELVERLSTFGLDLEPTKTRMLEFGSGAAARAAASGQKLGTFDFLGFTHYCDTTRDGKRYRVKRKTSAKKFRSKLAALKAWRQRVRHLDTRWIWQQVAVKLRGHYAYYGVTDNFEAIRRFKREAEKLLFRWLNRRGNRRSLTWEQFNLMRKRFPLPRPRLMVKLFNP